MKFEKTARLLAAKNEGVHLINNKIAVDFNRVNISDELKNYILAELENEARRYGTPSNIGGFRDNNGCGGKIYGDYIARICYVYDDNTGRQKYRVYKILAAQLVEYSAIDCYYNRPPSRVETTDNFKKLPVVIPCEEGRIYSA